MPYGYCECGCGGRTSVAQEADSRIGAVKGQPRRFIHNHHARIPLESRFWEKVDRRSPRECWPWNASRNAGGYGQIMVGAYRGGKKRPLISSRVAWELTNGPIPEGMLVCHHCDNPPCCNPEHLFLGTYATNMADAAEKGRTRGTYTAARNPNRKLTGPQVLEARREVTSGTTVASLARRFAVSHSTMSDAVKGLTWKHL